MNVNYNGKEIEIGAEDRIEDMFELICVCGHRLGDHSYTHAYGTFMRFVTSQCLRCGFHEKNKEHPQGFECEQFRVKPGKNDARWFNYPGLSA